MCQEKKGEEDSVVALTVSMTRRLIEKKKHRERLITATRNNTDNTSINWAAINKKTKIGKRTAKALQGTDKRNLTRENLNMVKKGNIKSETESLLIATQNITQRTIYVKARIDKVQKNSYWVSPTFFHTRN